MPTYCYKCPKCGTTEECIFPMSQSNRTIACPNCRDATMGRDHSAEAVKPGVKEYAGGHISDSLAMSSGQVQQHQQLHPDIKVHPDGRPEFRDTKQHSDYLKKIGWDKAPSKLKRRNKTSIAL